jgi:putative membrane protein
MDKGGDTSAPSPSTAGAVPVGDTSIKAGAIPADSSPSDASILAKARIGDSAEVAIAKYMEGATKTAGVKAYAQLLDKDHGKGMSTVDSVALAAKITPHLPASDTTAQETSHVIDHLKSLQGHDLDTAFVNHEVEDHEHDISDAKDMAAKAKNPAVEKMLEGELPELQKHLDKAKALGGKKGS